MREQPVLDTFASELLETAVFLLPKMPIARFFHSIRLDSLLVMRKEYRTGTGNASTD